MIRRLSVYMTYQKRKSFLSHIVLPQIRLQGKWLEKAGFSPGDKVVVECENGIIRIAKAKQNQEVSQTIIKQFILNL